MRNGPHRAIDTKKPSIARVYDFMLGGKDNFAIDRQVGELALQITPDGPEAARAKPGISAPGHPVTLTAEGRQSGSSPRPSGSGLPSQGKRA